MHGKPGGLVDHQPITPLQQHTAGEQVAQIIAHLANRLARREAQRRNPHHVAKDQTSIRLDPFLVHPHLALAYDAVDKRSGRALHATQQEVVDPLPDLAFGYFHPLYVTPFGHAATPLNTCSKGAFYRSAGHPAPIAGHPLCCYIANSLQGVVTARQSACTTDTQAGANRSGRDDPRQSEVPPPTSKRYNATPGFARAPCSTTEDDGIRTTTCRWPALANR